ncbi:hypothetical protein CPC08DRAFT_728335 [Agrocybe pediades]|nr:hypothetical protein CPC08DRAFT_728335 [Agrocybe pediades]
MVSTITQINIAMLKNLNGPSTLKNRPDIYYAATRGISDVIQSVRTTVEVDKSTKMSGGTCLIVADRHCSKSEPQPHFTARLFSKSGLYVGGLHLFGGHKGSRKATFREAKFDAPNSKWRGTYIQTRSANIQSYKVAFFTR